MKRTDLSVELQNLLHNVPYVSLATVCDDGRPWNTPLFVCFDDELNMYWASTRDGQHSRNIARDNHVFAVIYDSRAAEGAAQGLYLRMQAKMLTKISDISAAKKTYTTDFGEDGRHEPFIGDCERRLYMAVPEEVWTNGDDTKNGQFVDVRFSIADENQGC
jgi:general stress protein 26